MTTARFHVSVDSHNKAVADLNRCEEEVIRARERLDRALQELRTSIRKGGTTGRPVQDYFLMSDSPYLRLNRIPTLEGYMAEFRNQRGSPFLLAQEVVTGRSHRHTSSTRTDHVLGLLDESGEGFTVAYTDRTCYLQINAARFLDLRHWTKCNLTPSERRQGPIRICNLETKQNGGDGYFDAAGRMGFWIGQDAVREHLKQLRVSSATIEHFFSELMKD